MEEALLKVDFSWCAECDELFGSQEELKLHSENHRDDEAGIDITQNSDTTFPLRDEYKLLMGEMSLLKSGLCCGKCEKEFKNEKRLVKHIEKHDFKCEPKRFIKLNNYLNDLRKTRTEDNALRNIPTKNTSVQIDFRHHVSSLLLDSCLSDSNCEMTEGFSECDESSSLFHENLIIRKKSTIANSAAEVKQTRSNEKSHAVSPPAVLNPIGNDIHVSNNDVGATTGIGDDLTPPASPSKLNPKIVICNYCYVSYDFKSKLKRHIVKRHLHEHEIEDDLTLSAKPSKLTPKTVICNYCNVSYAFKWKLRDHIAKNHLCIQQHKCVICHNVFPSEDEMKSHLAIHFSRKKYICSVCNGNFSSGVEVVKHIKDSHKNIYGFVCSSCCVCFPSCVELDIHQACHIHKKKHHCSKCDKTFIFEKWFKLHVRKCQLGEVFHECEICGKEFIESRQLKMHSYSHDSVRRFPCQLCPKKFTQSSSVCEHIRSIHMKIKPHECSICLKSFRIRRYLINHQVVHSDERPFLCDKCGKTFKLKFRLKDHLTVLHPEV